MKTLKTLLAALPEIDTPSYADVDIAGITDDSRRVQPGFLFVAYKGVEADGHAYIADAIRRGAAAVVCERELRIENDELRKVSSQFPILNSQFSIQVPNGRRAFALLCAAWHDYPSRDLTLIGVTGTDGKTTTTNLIYNILKAAGLRAGMISTVNAVIGERALDTGLHVTTPDADEVQDYLAQMRDAGMTHCALEVTSHGLAHYRVDGCEFDVAVVTNITHEHLDLHGSREAYRAAKARLFEMAEQHVLNADDDFSFSYLLQVPADRRAFYSRQTNPEKTLEVFDSGDWWLCASRVDHASGSIDIDAFKPGQRIALPVKTHLVGDFNVSNILAACGAAMLLGIPVEAIQAGVASLHGIPGRMERFDCGQPFLAVVDFAHTPNALDNCLRTLRQITPGKLFAVFGCAGERDGQKRHAMGKIAAGLADVAIFTAEDPRRESLDAIMAEMERGARDARPMRAEILKIDDRGEAIRAACKMAQAGDTVVACGKGHEQSMCFGATEYAWDDRLAMREALRGQPFSHRLPTSIDLH
jgi:UDP-N-acetylmuramoyl-L-alanyl-D-glutamate--2,6-diaminopimelate ligase